jgi:hypothetical protein
MTRPRTRLFIIGLFIAALVFHVAIVAQDFSVLARNGFLYDDSFYAFKIAQNIAHGNGVSFDGVHPTNGFQPLYVFMIVPFYAVAGSDLIGPIYAALVLSALLTAITAVLLFKIIGRYTSMKIAALMAIVWAFSPVVTKQAANGLETSLALCMFASVVYFYLSRIRSVERPPAKHFVWLGVLMGLAVLARIDEAFLVLVITLDYLVVLRRRGVGAGALKNVGAAALAALVVYSPWLIYSGIAIGNIFQDSGSATRYLSIAYAPFFGLGRPELVNSGPDAGFLWGHLVHSFSVMKLAPPVHAAFRGLEKIGVTVDAAGALAIAANVIGLALVAGFIYLVVFKRSSLGVKGFDELQFLLLFAVVMIAAYSFYVFGVFFFARYYFPLYFIACIYAGLLLEEVLRRVPVGLVRARAAVGALLVVYLAAFGYMAYTCACRSHAVYCFYDVAGWVEDNTSPDDTIGVFQSGAIGYLSDRRVINLDGKVNNKALDALKKNDLGSYLRTEGVDIIVDNKKVLELFLTDDFGKKRAPDPLVVLGLDPIMDGRAEGVPDWAAYRVNGFAKSHGGPSTTD